MKRKPRKSKKAIAASSTNSGIHEKKGAMQETRTESSDPTLPPESGFAPSCEIKHWLESPKFNGIGVLVNGIGSIGAIISIGVAAFVFFCQSSQTERQIAQQQDQLDFQRTTFEATERSRIIGILYSASQNTPTADIRSRQEALAAFFKIEGAKNAPIDLSKAMLSNLKFSSDWNLRGANLSGAILEDAEFVDVDLTSATLKGALLVSANFSNAILDYADLSGNKTQAQSAIFIGASLKNANLSHGQFEYAYLCGVDLSSASADETNWEHAKYDSITKWPQGANPNPKYKIDGSCEGVN